MEPQTMAVEECLFRMLEPHEVAAGMAFTPGYVVLGNKREKPPSPRSRIAAVRSRRSGCS
jgi:DNA (cytosine-5)-methyltransferase 1